MLTLSNVNLSYAVNRRAASYWKLGDRLILAQSRKALKASSETTIRRAVPVSCSRFVSTNGAAAGVCRKQQPAICCDVYNRSNNLPYAVT